MSVVGVSVVNFSNQRDRFRMTEVLANLSVQGKGALRSVVVLWQEVTQRKLCSIICLHNNKTICLFLHRSVRPSLVLRNLVPSRPRFSY